MFVALRFPAAVRAALWRATAPLRETEASVRWTPEPQLHLTLRFLGSVPEPRIPSVRAALERPAAAIAPFRLGFAAVGAFPSLRRPRVLWIGVDGGAALPALHAGTERALAALGFAPEGRPFRPHVTLGRVRERGRVDADEIARAVAAVASPEGCEIGALHLMRSRLGRDGARHEVEASVALAGG